MKAPKLPTEFRGIFWDDKWEFDGPVVIYFPGRFRRFDIAGNAGGIEKALEDICEGIVMGEDPTDGGLVREAEWRGWSLRGFARRKGEHEVWTVRWTKYADGRLDYLLERKLKGKG